jgi:hypothetical protein
MANYYHVRLLAASGQPLHRDTVFTLAKAIKQLNRFTGIEWPYQVIHRHFKSGMGHVWAEACLVTTESSPACIAVIEDAGSTAGELSSWWEHNPAPAAEAQVPAGWVKTEKPCVYWTEKDWERYREGSQIYMFVEE